MRVRYNKIEEHGRDVWVLHIHTAFRVYDSLLETDYLRTLINALIENGEHDPTLTTGRLVSNRRSLKKKLTTEGITADLVLNRFLEEEIERDSYLFLQQYVGYYVLRSAGAGSMDLRIKRGVYENYFRFKGIKLAQLNQGSIWKLESVKDIIQGYCTLGHEIRYAYTAVSNLGDRVVFGSTCIGDFFEIDEQLADQLHDYVSRIKAVTDEYYNDYHAYHEVHLRLDKILRVLVMYIQKVSNGVIFTANELGYINGFVDRGMPIPKPLSYDVGLKVQRFLETHYDGIYSPISFSAVARIVDFLGNLSLGAHGFTRNEINHPFPINYLGDRVMPEDVKRFTRYTSKDFKKSTSSDSLIFNTLVSVVDEGSVKNILHNLFQLKQLGLKLANDDDFKTKIGAGNVLSYASYKGYELTSDTRILNMLFNLPIIEKTQGQVDFLVSERLELTYNKTALNTVETAFLSELGDLPIVSYQQASRMRNAKVSALKKLVLRQDKPILASNIVYRFIDNLKVEGQGSKEVEQWVDKVVKYNGLEQQFNKLLESDESDQIKGSSKQNESNPTKLKYETLLKDAKTKYADQIKTSKLDFSVKILETVARTGRVTPKQQPYITRLENFINKLNK